MDETSAQAFLQALWGGAILDSQKCYQCGSAIDLRRDVLARTFCLKSQYITQGRPFDQAIPIEIPELQDQMLLFNRHLNCLFQSTNYVAISHIWDRDVADLQRHRKKSADRTASTAQHVREISARVCRGVVASLNEFVEVWHDYISVPQWQDDAKTAILQVIQQIFRHAMFTTVYLSDLEAATLGTMRHGDSQSERCLAISRTCNAKWFSRVWTAMEFTQSPKICFMTKEFTLSTENIRNELNHESLVAELHRRWTVEITKNGNDHELERLVGMGYNLVPWQLGPLEPIRQHNIEGTRNSFAMAIDLLARRCITIPRDFFHALLAILRTDLVESDLAEDPSEALLQVARNCVKDGDFSPLFMTPAAVQGVPNENRWRQHGYHDINTFALGRQFSDPRYRETRSNPANNNPIVKVERIGTVHRIVPLNLPHGVMETSRLAVELTLEVTGVEIDEFVRNLGRLFCVEDTRKIFRRLSENGRRAVLQTKLGILKDILIDADWAFQLELHPHPLLRVHKQSKDDSEQQIIDLSEALGNHNGTFSEAGRNFHLSAKEVRLVGTNLLAKLRTIHGEWSDAEFDVRKLAPQPHEHLHWICDAIGLYEADLGISGRSPWAWLNTHGGSLHLGWHSAIVSVNCPSCGKTFLLRAAVYAKDYLLTNSVAFTIPGLKYAFTFQDGTGFLANRGRLVGRLIWAAPTCECQKLEEVELLLDDLPLPHPNTLEYGEQGEPGKMFPVIQVMHQIG